MEMSWFNFKTQKYDYRDTPTDYTDYIPQVDSAQSLYKLYIDSGKTPQVAAILVLEA